MFKQKASIQREEDPDLDFIVELKDITIECGQELTERASVKRGVIITSNPFKTPDLCE